MDTKDYSFYIKYCMPNCIKISFCMYSLDQSKILIESCLLVVKFRNHRWHFWSNPWTPNADVITLKVSKNSTSENLNILVSLKRTFQVDQK